mmetsp:Transcript_68335/g.160194  ORF Transcript_68335/g.160194 Transcript_68335/m.160194 type:complete len:228 (-) Transcript_68335:544-1227(-)
MSWALNSESLGLAAAASTANTCMSRNSRLAKAQAVLQMAWQSKLPTAPGRELAIASIKGSYWHRSVAKAHRVLESSCARNDRIQVVAASAITAIIGESSNARLAIAQAMLLSACGVNAVRRRMAWRDMASINGTSDTSNVANAHTMLETSWALNSASFSKLSAAMSCSTGPSENCSLANDHARFERLRVLNSERPLRQTLQELRDMTYRTGSSRHAKVAKAHASIAS